MKRVLSGIQPTGILHLGNYLGAIKQWVEGQERLENFICIVDLHAITVKHDPAELHESTRKTAALLIAAGIDPARSTLFVQSHVRAHAEASWLLQCVTPLGWIERMTQYKDKARNQEILSTGLLTYPILQAADILLYDPDTVPVGEDQKQHVELTRDIAQRFNNLFGETFKLPQPDIPKIAARVMGLDDPTAKMSKSAKGSGHAVLMIDDEKQILKTFKRAVTDSGREISFSDDPARAGVNNLLGIYRALTGKCEAETVQDFAEARGYGDLKQAVADVVIEALAPIRKRYLELIEEPTELDRILLEGSGRATAEADAKLHQMKQAMGFLL